MKDSLGLIVCGVGGRMGGTIARLIQETPGVVLAEATDRAGSPRIGQDSGEVAGAGQLGVAVTDRIDAAAEGRRVIVDFTTPEASLTHMKAAAKAGIPIVIGTTGFQARHLRQIRTLGAKTPTVLAPNMSLGVNLLLGLVGQVARSLGDTYDVEIVEAHHRFKKDAPSGTALALARSAAEALGRKLERVGVPGRNGVSERKTSDIGLISVRAGDIAGEHTVLFGGIGERIELVHRAHSREAFARGAIRAAQWLADKDAGLYTMQDVLGLADGSSGPMASSR
ncbi:MAG: 4-hydroxy-tetrahydrodipicolinate reductase [Deltaproteobacteria bacterium]|nr:4-hydroxy-tetrahydrodipicolinate reductase [Deltaproteobacteria bacterium]